MIGVEVGVRGGGRKAAEKGYVYILFISSELGSTL